MKRILALLMTLTVIAAAAPKKTPAVPVGLMNATPKVVQTGTYPTLTWDISYPSSVADVAVIDGSGSILLTKSVYVDVRAVGVGVTKTGTDTSGSPAEIRLSVGGGSYNQLFYGTNAQVDPTHSLYTKKLNRNATINLGGRYVTDSGWSTFRSTGNSSMQIKVLTNGVAAPATAQRAEYLKPYIDSAGKVQVGPLSVLVMAEYAETGTAKDYQDAAFLVSFSPKNNNGHGNNLDGVDSSNPGGGSGGPNGGVDPSGDVDDER